MNSEMYVTGNDCYGSGARARISLTLSPFLVSLRWCADGGLEGSGICIKPSKTGELWRRRWRLGRSDVSPSTGEHGFVESVREEISLKRWSVTGCIYSLCFKDGAPNGSEYIMDSAQFIPVVYCPTSSHIFSDASCDELKHPNQSESTCWADEEVVALFFSVFVFWLVFDLFS